MKRVLQRTSLLVGLGFLAQIGFLGLFDNSKITVLAQSIPTTLQEMTDGYCSSLPALATVTLTDSRDGKSYRIRKFADGNCWMIDNLAYGGSTTDGCSGKSIFDGGYTSDGVGRSVSGTWTGALGTSAESFYGSCEDPRGMTCSGPTGCDSAYCSTHDCGYYYSWQAAVQNSLAYYGNTYQPTEPVTGICPAGWQLPTGTGDNSFQALHSAMGYTTNGPVTTTNGRQYWGCATGCTGFWQATPWAGLFSGYATYNGAIYDQGLGGYWWSSSQYSSVYSYSLRFSSGWVNPPGSDSKFHGFSVRCLYSPAETSFTPTTLQDMTDDYCYSMAPSDTLTLTDSRDGKSYRIRKFADGNCWMIDNLAYGGSTTDGCSGKSTFDGGYASTGVGRSVSGTWTGAVGTSAESFYGSCEDPKGMTCSNPSDGCSSNYCSTHNCGYYYSWQAAMQNSLAYYGNTYQPTEPVTGICPAGWQLPAGTGDNSFQALHSAMGYTTNGPHTTTDNRQYWNCATGCTGFWQATPWAGLFSGYATYNGAIYDQGLGGYWWSSSQYSSVYSYSLRFSSGWVNPPGSDSKFHGFSVRCLYSPPDKSPTYTETNPAIDPEMISAFQKLADMINVRFAGQIYVPVGTSPGSGDWADYTYLSTLDANHQIWTVNLKLTDTANAGNINVPLPIYLQSFTSENCAALTTCTATANCATNGSTITLKDARDNKTYRVRRFADGNCWMIDNLAYGGTTEANGTLDACAAKVSFSGNGQATPYVAWYSGSRQLYGDCRNAGSYPGYLYNWQAAIQNSLAYFGSNYQPTEPVTGICPTGWILPANTGDYSFYNLHTTYGSPTSTNFWANSTYWNGVYSGRSNNTGTLHGQSSVADYWSSTQYNSTNGYYFYFGADGIVIPQGYYNKDNGFAVRCVFQQPAAPTTPPTTADYPFLVRFFQTNNGQTGYIDNIVGP